MTVNRAAARNLTWAGRVDDDTPHPDSLAVLEAIGAVDPDLIERPRAIVVDDTTPVSLDDRGTRVGNASQPPPINRPDPRHDRRNTPPGLRDLPPPAEKRPVTKPPVAKRTRPKVARRAISEPAAAPAVPARRRPGRKVKEIEHGTPRGYRAHYRLHVLPLCEPCKNAGNEAKAVRSAVMRARRSVANHELVVSSDFDAWLGQAQYAASPAVRHAAAVAVSALMAFRIAIGDLARAEQKPSSSRQESA